MQISVSNLAKAHQGKFSLSATYVYLNYFNRAYRPGVEMNN